mmetsp:Transcript_66413/g.194401  ORF Transcript_66413/g.194401 Transcript_66413/m.194401 type:complete len:202 (-) Transcript_66413:219-824(-)
MLMKAIRSPSSLARLPNEANSIKSVKSTKLKNVSAAGSSLPMIATIATYRRTAAISKGRSWNHRIGKPMCTHVITRSMTSKARESEAYTSLPKISLWSYPRILADLGRSAKAVPVMSSIMKDVTAASRVAGLDLCTKRLHRNTTMQRTIANINTPSEPIRTRWIQCAVSIGVPMYNLMYTTLMNEIRIRLPMRPKASILAK